MPLLLLLWLAVPFAIYRSKKRWTTFFLTIGTWLGTGVLLAFVSSLLVTRGDAEALGRVIGQFALLIAIIVCGWHSQKTRKGAPEDKRVILI